MPLYIVLEVNDEIEDVQGMMSILSQSEKATLDVEGFRFTDVRVQRVGTVSP